MWGKGDILHFGPDLVILKFKTSKYTSWPYLGLKLDIVSLHVIQYIIHMTTYIVQHYYHDYDLITEQLNVIYFKTRNMYKYSRYKILYSMIKWHI
jgi:hypothetical protein